MVGQRQGGAPRLWAREGGEGSTVLLLLHGLGACSSAWDPLLAVAAAKWPGRWIAPDLRGHGRSPHFEPYSYGDLAADVLSLTAPSDTLYILGHSMGGALALTIAAGPAAAQVRCVAAMSVRLEFDAAELAKLRELAAAKARHFASQQEAVERYLKVSGLAGLVPADSEAARHGVVQEGANFRLAMDPRANLLAQDPVAHLLDSVQCPVRLVTGSDDPIAPPAMLRKYQADALVLPGCGHNLHVQAPEAVWAAVGPLLVPKGSRS